MKNKKLSSIIIHNDTINGTPHKAHLNPIYATSTYCFDSSEEACQAFQGENRSYIYSRMGTPSHHALEKLIEDIEVYDIPQFQGINNPVKALLFSSGMGAISALFFSLLTTGDEILTHYSLYGGAQEFLAKILQPLRIFSHISDFQDLNEVEEILKKNPKIKLMYIETPANPTLQCVDMEALTKLAKKYHVKIACDNTFSTAYIQQPFLYDVDFVVYSATKFLNGHGNSISGILIGKDIQFMKQVVFQFYKLLGAYLSPFDVFLLGNGIKTLPLRLNKHCENAEFVANFLVQHPKVAKVNYCGLASALQLEIIQKQMKKNGSILSFEVAGGQEAALKWIDQLKMCKHAVSLGVLDTIVCHPYTSVHVGVDKKEKEIAGITTSLIRVSVGIEDIDDILEDFENAFEKI